MDDERARKAQLAGRIRSGVIAAGAAGALGLTGMVALQGSSSTSGDGTIHWHFAGDNGSLDQQWQPDGGSWSVRPQDLGGGLAAPHAQSGGS